MVFVMVTFTTVVGQWVEEFVGIAAVDIDGRVEVMVVLEIC